MVCDVDIAVDWSDHGLWWPEKNLWLVRTRSTLDQYGVQADAKLLFTPMHKYVRVLLPDLQEHEMRINFSTNVFSVVIKMCKEFGLLIFVIFIYCCPCTVHMHRVLCLSDVSFVWLRSFTTLRIYNRHKIVAACRFSFQYGPQDRISDKAVHAHTVSHAYRTHHSWWLVLDWVTTKIDHPLF